ncbi:MAG: SRPBCC family protein [Propionibacteriaceae bacterium]
MPILQLRAHGTAPVEVAWERYADPACWAEWSPQIRAVATVATRIAPGVRGTVVAPFGMRVPFEVLAVDEAARTWRWRVRLGPAAIELDHAVRSENGQTLTTLDLSGPLSAVPLLLGYAPVAQFALRRLVTP